MSISYKESSKERAEGIVVERSGCEQSGTAEASRQIGLRTKPEMTESRLMKGEKSRRSIACTIDREIG